MARVKDLWFSEVKDPSDPGRKIRRKTARHPDNGGGKDAKRWLAIWIDADGKEKSKAFRIKERAKAHGDRMEADVERGEYIDPAAGKVLYGDLGRRWLRLRDVGGSTDRRYESAFRLHIEPTFGHRQVKSVKPSEVLEWLRDLAETHGASTQETAVFIVRGIFDLAMADGMRRDNPAKSPIVIAPTYEAPERTPWNVAQIWVVIDSHTDPYRLIPIVSAGCGLRQGEALGLAEDDFDFDAGLVTIRRQLTRIGGKTVFKLPKGGKERTSPLSPGIARAVRAHFAAYPPRAYSLPWMKEDGKLAEDEHTAKILFRWHGDDPRTHDRHIPVSSYDRLQWKPSLVAAGVIPPPVKDAQGIHRHHAARQDGTHALRHYFVTTLLDAGVSLAGVMEFAGHSKKGAPVTLGVYGHVTEETYESAREAIDKSLFRLRAVQDRWGSSGTSAEQAASQ